MPRRLVPALLLLTGVCSLIPQLSPRAGTRANDPPSIVFILTDDQRTDMLWAMPHVEHAILHQGEQFDDAFVSNPLCCPSRSAILTGRFSHSTDVWRNEPPDGGFQTFTERGEDQSMIATWLHAAGYHTGLVGKYLNGYD